jgi:hypothetical protein
MPLEQSLTLKINKDSWDKVAGNFMQLQQCLFTVTWHLLKMN